MTLSKSIRTWALLAIMAVALAPAALQAQTKTQKSLIAGLRSMNFNPVLNNTNNSVEFKHNKDTYWITATGRVEPYLYTLYRVGYNIPGQGAEYEKHLQEAELACAQMNATSNTKTYIEDRHIVFSFPMYAETPEAFLKALHPALRDLGKVKEEFKKYYRTTAPELVKERLSSWADYDTTRVVIPQRARNLPQAAPSMAITGFDICVVDENGQTLIPYGENVRQSRCQYVRPKVNVKASDKGTFKLTTKIYDPQGRLMVPAVGANYTTVTPVSFDKKGKPEECELTPFGSNDNNRWAPGRYTIEFWEDGTKLYSDSFNVL